ncbi:hypothetical protein TNCV_3910331 [Trichonephila clavipes]|nr:hypothetical protein TNCV_3910331 [Trichonephila clavipes]
MSFYLSGPEDPSCSGADARFICRGSNPFPWCSVEFRRGGANSGVDLETSQWFKITRFIASSPRVALQFEVN